jgi:predicted nucleotidyltransferase
MGLEYNEENGEVRLGTLIHKLIQQRYTKPELKRLLGTESEAELKSFDEVENDTNGRPLYGKKYRRIKASRNIKESAHKDKFDISEDDAGVSSFIARPEYIRTSDMDIAVESGRKASQLRSIEFKKYTEAIQLYIQLLPLAQPNPNTGEALLDASELPPIKLLIAGLLKSLDLDPDIKNEKQQKSEMEQKVEAYMAMEKSRLPLTTQPIAQTD